MKRGDTVNVLFVCTGNIFRSMTAEYCLKKFIKDNKIKRIKVSSAGITAHKQPARKSIKDKLLDWGIDISKHKQRHLTKKIVKESDIIIAMGRDHKRIIKERFGITVPLFDEIAYRKRIPILDNWEAVHDYRTNQKANDRYCLNVARRIRKASPLIGNRLLDAYFLFSDFVNKGTRHRTGLPFIPLHETRHSLAFFSIDIPFYEDGHVLVIPKKRYTDLDDIPSHIRADMLDVVCLIAKALKLDHDGYNVLLNNGMYAGQYIFHTHFHIIPRREDDHIKIEVWKKRKKISRREFVEYNMTVKGNIEKIKKKKIVLLND